MRRYLLLLLAASITFGCRKTEKVATTEEPAVVDIAHSTGLRLNAVGDYENYQLISAETGKFGQIADFSLKNGSGANVGDLKDEPHQKWRITRVSTADFKIMNMGSGKFLEAYNNNGTQQLVQGNESSANTQLWRITLTAGNQYKAVNKANGLAITANGTGAVTLEAFANKTSQQWGYNALPAISYRDDEVSRFFQRTTGTQAWDGNHSLTLKYGKNKGKVLWLTNDEFYNQLMPNGLFRCYGTTMQFFHKNNAAMLQPASLSWDPAQTHNMFVTSNGRQYDEEVFHDFFGRVLWPTGVIEINDKIIVSLIQVNGLTMIQQKIGIIDQDDNTSTVITVPGYSDQTAIEYSVGFFRDGDYAYIYGKDSGNNLYVGRFAIADPMKCTFWNGTDWVDKPTTAVAARVLRSLPSGGISVNKVNGKYVVVSHDFGFFCNGGRNFYSWTSTAPNAPFGNKRTLFKRTDYRDGVLPVFYTPIIHPQFNNGKDELLITYCVNFYPPCIQECQNGAAGVDPDGYRPKAIRVPYSLIGI